VIVQLYAAEVTASFNREKVQFRSNESTSRTYGLESSTLSPRRNKRSLLKDVYNQDMATIDICNPFKGPHLLSHSALWLNVTQLNNGKPIFAPQPEHLAGLLTKQLNENASPTLSLTDVVSASQPWSNNSPSGLEELVRRACLPSTASNVCK
jgi:hypothetical protein